MAQPRQPKHQVSIFFAIYCRGQGKQKLINSTDQDKQVRMLSQEVGHFSLVR